RAARLLGERGGRRGDQRTGRVVDEQLEREGGALDDLPPAAGVPALADPIPPEILRLAEQPAGLALGDRVDVAVPLQVEVGLLAFFQRERRRDSGLLDLEADVGPQHDPAHGRGEDRAYALNDLD